MSAPLDASRRIFKTCPVVVVCENDVLAEKYFDFNLKSECERALKGDSNRQSMARHYSVITVAVSTEVFIYEVAAYCTNDRGRQESKRSVTKVEEVNR